MYFGTGASFWAGLQMKCDLDVAEDELEDYLIESSGPSATRFTIKNIIDDFELNRGKYV